MGASNRLPATIMIVDDTPANLQVLVDFLRTEGFRVRPVTSGSAALALAAQARPDLVLLDVCMPAEGVFHNLVLVRINKRFPGHARKVMHGLWGLGQGDGECKGEGHAR